MPVPEGSRSAAWGTARRLSPARISSRFSATSSSGAGPAGLAKEARTVSTSPLAAPDGRVESTPSSASRRSEGTNWVAMPAKRQSGAPIRWPVRPR